MPCEDWEVDTGNCCGSGKWILRRTRCARNARKTWQAKLAFAPSPPSSAIPCYAARPCLTILTAKKNPAITARASVVGRVVVDHDQPLASTPVSHVSLTKGDAITLATLQARPRDSICIPMTPSRVGRRQSNAINYMMLPDSGKKLASTVPLHVGFGLHTTLQTRPYVTSPKPKARTRNPRALWI